MSSLAKSIVPRLCSFSLDAAHFSHAHGFLSHCVDEAVHYLPSHHPVEFGEEDCHSVAFVLNSLELCCDVLFLFHIGIFCVLSGILITNMEVCLFGGVRNNAAGEPPCAGKCQ